MKILFALTTLAVGLSVAPSALADFGVGPHRQWGSKNKGSCPRPTSSGAALASEATEAKISPKARRIRTVTAYTTYHTTVHLTMQASQTPHIHPPPPLAGAGPPDSPPAPKPSTSSATMTAASQASDRAPPPPASSPQPEDTSTPATKPTSEAAPPPASTPAAAPGEVAPAKCDNSETEIKQFLDTQNAFRATHDAKPLRWNATLADAAKRWSDGCKWEHSGGKLGPYGENLVAATSPVTLPALLKQWTDESQDYFTGMNLNTSTELGNENFHKVGHFTQLVWKDSEEIGCACTICEAGKIMDAKYRDTTYVVCEYSAPGNMVGQYTKQVTPDKK